MNPRGRPLPPELGSGFLTRDARAAGLAVSRLRARDLELPFWGIRSIVADPELHERCGLIQLRMPSNTFFSHVTAAALYKIPLPRRLEQSKQMDIGTPAPHRAPHAKGIIGHQLTVSAHDLTEIAGLRVSTPARTWCDLGSVLSLFDLVAAGDFVIRRSTPLATVRELVEVAHARVSPRGRANVQAALRLLNDRSESPRESLLRLIVHWAGLPDPRVNHEFFDTTGTFIARVDLFIEELDLILEYQGDYHRTDKMQWRNDMTRRSKLEAIGLRFMEFNADDLTNPTELIARIRKRATLRA